MEWLSNYIQNNPLASMLISIITGGIITVIVGYIFYKLQIKKPTIHYKLSEPLDIGKGLSELFPDFSLTFQSHPLKGNIKVIKGTIINDSDESIKTAEGFRDFTVELPKTCTFLDVQTYNLSYGLVVKHAIDSSAKNIIRFEMPSYFLSNNSFEFAALFDDSSGNSNHIIMDTTIPDTKLKDLSSTVPTFALLLLDNIMPEYSRIVKGSLELLVKKPNRF